MCLSISVIKSYLSKIENGYGLEIGGRLQTVWGKGKTHYLNRQNSEDQTCNHAD